MSHRLSKHADEAAEVLDLAEAARFLKISERHAWRLARAGELPHRRLGNLYRFSRGELRDFMRKGARDGVSG